MKLKNILLITAGILGVLATASCEKKGPAEKAGEKIDEAAEDVKESAEDAKDKVKDAVEEAGDDIEEATDN